MEESIDREFEGSYDGSVMRIGLMKHMGRTRRTVQVLLGISVIALLAASFPHTHEKSRASDLKQSCQACKLQDSFSATPTVSALTHALPPPVTVQVLPPAESPRVALVISSSSPRAPPALS